MAGGIDLSSTWNIFRFVSLREVQKNSYHWTTVSWKDKCIGRYCIMFQIDSINIVDDRVVEIFTSFIVLSRCWIARRVCNEHKVTDRILEKKTI